MSQEPVFQFDDYKSFFTSWLSRNGENRGGVSKVASFLKVHPSYISQVLKGDKDFSQEQAFKLADHLNLNDLGRDYFIHLVLEAKAGTHSLKKYYRSKRETLRKSAKQVKKNIGKTYQLSEVEKARFYSDPIYSQIRLLTSIERFNTAEDIANAMGLPIALVSDIVRFLVDTGLCTMDENGNLKMGVSRTHLGAESPLVKTHHRNWRSKVSEMYHHMDENDLVFTAPLTIAKKDFDMLREEIMALIGKVTEVVDKTTEEEFAVFNIDWIRWHEKQ